MEETIVELKEENLQNVCRLCLQEDEELTINIFDRIDPNPRKRPLSQRIFELYQIRISIDDGLPTNICHRCLYNTEVYSEFREKVLQCETKLHNFVLSLGRNNGTDSYSNGYMDEAGIYAEEDNVVVVDPSKIYDSSDDENVDVDATKSELQVNHDPETIETGLGNIVPQFSLVMPETSIPKSATLKRRNSEGPEGFRNVHFCQYCEAAFVDREQCLAHETTSHDPYMPHQCNFCAFRCASRNIIIAHIKQCHEPEKPFVCVHAQCNKKFGRRSDLKKHSVCHTGIRPFGCPVCSKSFSRNTNLTKHMKIHEGMRPFICPQCPRSFSNAQDLQRHELVHDEAKKLFQCTKCPAKFSRRDKFQHHERNHLRKELMSQTHDSENMVIDLDPFLDPNEEYQAANRHHPPIIPSELKIENDIQKALLTLSHVKSENGFSKHVTGDAISFSKLGAPKPPELPKNFACDQCPKRFNKLSSLHNHRIVHMGRNAGALPTHSCSVCPKVFKTKRELDRHSLVHSGIKSFQCLTCFRRFARKDKLVRHEKIHQERAPLEFPNQMLANDQSQQVQQVMPDLNSQLHMMMMAPRANFYMNNESLFSDQSEVKHESL